MSWTSPLTVAVTIVPARRPVPSRSRLEVRDEDRDGLLHDPGALDDLGQEHPAGPEQVADDVHPGHQRALDDVERTGRGEARLLGVLDDVGVDAGHQGVGQALVDRSLAPGQVLGGALHPGARRRTARPARAGAPWRRGGGSRTTSSTRSRSSGSMSS